MNREWFDDSQSFPCILFSEWQTGQQVRQRFGLNWVCINICIYMCILLLFTFQYFLSNIYHIYIYNTHAFHIRFVCKCMLYQLSGKLYIHCSYTFGFGHASFQDDCMGIAFFGSLISHWSHDFASDKFDCNILMVVIFALVHLLQTWGICDSTIRDDILWHVTRRLTSKELKHQDCSYVLGAPNDMFGFKGTKSAQEGQRFHATC